MNQPKILLVEDDKSLGFLLQDNLEMHGFQVHLCEDGEAGLRAFRGDTFHLCVLDVMMPAKDGFTLANDIRTQNQHIPIVFLTARGDKEDRIKGFKAGADDYITKPFSIEEFILRIQAILRRSGLRPDLPKTISFGNYHLDLENLSLDAGSVRHQLTEKEAHLLRFFAQHPNQLLQRDHILNAVWKDDGYFVGRSMDVFISRLRKYFGDDPTVNIVNVHGRGYRFDLRSEPGRIMGSE